MNNARRARLAFGTLFALMCASCGGSDGDAENVSQIVGSTPPSSVPTTIVVSSPPKPTDATQAPPSTDAPVATQTPSPTSTSDQTTATDSDPATSGADDVSIRSVASALTEPLQGRGWRFPAGTWSSTHFDPPLAFTTTEDMVIRRESGAAVLLASALPGYVGELSITIPASINTQLGDVPVPDPDEVTEMLTALPGVELVDSGEFPRLDGTDEVNWWEIIPTDPNRGLSCSLGDACQPSVRLVSGESLNNLEEVVSRYYATRIGDDVMIGLLASDTSGIDRMVEHADAIMASIASQAPTEAGGVGDTQFLHSMGVRSPVVPAGRWSARIGEVLIDLKIDDDLTSVVPNSFRDTLLYFQSQSLADYLLVMDVAGLLDPGAEQSTDTLADFDAVLEPQPRTAADFESWAESMATILDRGVADIGGREIPWFDLTVDASNPNTTRCGDRRYPIDNTCIDLIAAETLWFVADVETIRFYFDEGTATMILIGSIETEINAAVENFKPLLDALTITPIDS